MLVPVHDGTKSFPGLLKESNDVFYVVHRCSTFESCHQGSKWTTDLWNLAIRMAVERFSQDFNHKPTNWLWNGFLFDRVTSRTTLTHPPFIPAGLPVWASDSRGTSPLRPGTVGRKSAHACQGPLTTSCRRNNVNMSAISITHGPLTRCAKLRVAHAPGMPGMFSPPPTSKETAS